MKFFPIVLLVLSSQAFGVSWTLEVKSLNKLMNRYTLSEESFKVPLVNRTNLSCEVSKEERGQESIGRIIVCMAGRSVYKGFSSALSPFLKELSPAYQKQLLNLYQDHHPRHYFGSGYANCDSAGKGPKKVNLLIDSDKGRSLALVLSCSE